MSNIQKPSKNANYLKKPRLPFEMIYRQILNKLRNANALAIYVHLLGKPENWVINNRYIEKHFGWGEHKAADAMNCLIVNGLMKRTQHVSEKGQFTIRTTELMDGYDFKEFIEYDKKNKDHKEMCKFLLENRNRSFPRMGKTENSENSGHKEEDIKASKKEYKNKERYRSPNLNEIPDDFFPDDERITLLNHHAIRTNNPTKVLLDKFIEVSNRYRTKSNDWQKTFSEFLERELPVRVYENEKGQKTRYDEKQTSRW